MRRIGSAAGLVAALAVAAVLALASDAALAGKKTAKKSKGVCSATSATLFVACKHEAQDDHQVARAICLNLADPAERDDCREEARDGFAEDARECSEVRAAREDLCDAVGEAPYEPDFDPASFDDPRSPTNPNPYFPLAVGNRWVVADGSDTVEIEVLDKLKSIEGVPCIVVSDVELEGGVPVEITADWFAQRKNGDVVYCGESTAEYETFAGDDPEEPELVSIEGSFKAGRDGDKPGTLFPASPSVGETHRQEWSPGNAEDAATVLSTSYAYGNDPVLDQLVPPALAQLLCAAGDCVVTAEFTPLEPDALEHKYYARGIGFFLATKPEDGGVEQLVACNFDARCASLPQP